MATKNQIKKFLEARKCEAINKLKEESNKKQEEIKDLFFSTYQDELKQIRSKLIFVGNEYENFVKIVEDLGIVQFKHQYRCPSSVFNDLISNLSDTNLKDYHINFNDANKVKSIYDKKINDCEIEYDNLIALCNANSSKESIKILENLGFDLSLIDAKKETTALITEIDANKLYI